jgi:hypothetical protein
MRAAAGAFIGTDVASACNMAILWREGVAAPTCETPAEIGWRLQFASVLAASGFEAVIIREVLVPHEGAMPDFAGALRSRISRDASR